MKFTKLALALAATFALAAPTIAQDDNSDVVGTWFGTTDITVPAQATGPTYGVSIWQFRADGTFTQVDTAFAGIMAINGKQSMQTGIVSPYMGQWKRDDDGTVSIVGVHFESNAPGEGVEGQLKMISKITDKFNPETGELNHCFQMLPTPNGLYDPAKGLDTLPPIEQCPVPDSPFNTTTQLTRIDF